MEFISIFLIFILLFCPFKWVFIGRFLTQNKVTLTADQVTGAIDIENAIRKVTAEGTHPGAVVLDGRKGVFIFSEDDRSVNIFVSNLILSGVNGAVINNCADGLFFDDLQLQNILVEGISFLCSGNGVVAAGKFKNVILSKNLFQVDGIGIGAVGSLRGWVISGNLIQAGSDGIRMTDAQNGLITGNHLSALIGINLQQGSKNQVWRNAIQATYQGILLGQETWGIRVQANTILGVSAAGIALEPGVMGNRILANSVLCNFGSSCLTVDAIPETAKMNKIAGNRP